MLRANCVSSEAVLSVNLKNPSAATVSNGSENVLAVSTAFTKLKYLFSVVGWRKFLLSHTSGVPLRTCL